MANPAKPARFVIESLDEEPWVKLASGQELANWEHADEVIYNQQNRQMEKYRFYVHAFDYLNDSKIIGNYHEFGCHRVRTFRMALTEARRHEMNQMNFFGYDSFEGLPQTTTDPAHEVWKTKGTLATSEKEFRKIVDEHGIYTDHIITTKGFYQKSLTRDLQKKLIDEGNKIALACIDCDLYESAVPVFKFIEPLLQEGALIYIDDLFVGYRGSPGKGVAKAFLEFQEQSRFSFTRHLDVGWWGRSYLVHNETVPAGAAL